MFLCHLIKICRIDNMLQITHNILPGTDNYRDATYLKTTAPLLNFFKLLSIIQKPVEK